MKQLKYKILLALFVISLISSILLSMASGTNIAFCDVDGGGGCDTVASSPQNYTFGIKNSYFGVAIFLALSVLTYYQIKNPTKQRRDLINAAVILGSIVAIYFIYLQKFTLQSYCTYCLVVDFSMIFALILTIAKWRD